MANFLGAAIAGQVASQADVANAVAPLATQAQLAAMQAQVQALLAPHNAPAIATAATATVQSIVASRLQNAHDRGDVAYVVVQRSDGTRRRTGPSASTALRSSMAPSLLLMRCSSTLACRTAQLSANGATRSRCT